MESLINFLDAYNPEPRYAQIANGGNWEDAVRIDFVTDASYDVSSLGEVDASIAGEVFYKLNDGRAIFFGLRQSGMFKGVTPNDFLKKFIHILEIVPNSSVREVLTELGKQLDNDPMAFTVAEVNYVELGVEGNWKSIGSKVLRKSGESSITQETVKQLVSDTSSLLKNSKNHTALEFAVSNPECWFGIQVSKEGDGEYITDLESVVTLSNMI